MGMATLEAADRGKEGDIPKVISIEVLEECENLSWMWCCGNLTCGQQDHCRMCFYCAYTGEQIPYDKSSEQGFTYYVNRKGSCRERFLKSSSDVVDSINEFKLPFGIVAAAVKAVTKALDNSFLGSVCFLFDEEIDKLLLDASKESDLKEVQTKTLVRSGSLDESENENISYFKIDDKVRRSVVIQFLDTKHFDRNKFHMHAAMSVFKKAESSNEFERAYVLKNVAAKIDASYQDSLITKDSNMAESIENMRLEQLAMTKSIENMSENMTKSFDALSTEIHDLKLKQDDDLSSPPKSTSEPLTDVVESDSSQMKSELEELGGVKVVK